MAGETELVLAIKELTQEIKAANGGPFRGSISSSAATSSGGPSAIVGGGGGGRVGRRGGRGGFKGGGALGRLAGGAAGALLAGAESSIVDGIVAYAEAVNPVMNIGRGAYGAARNALRGGSAAGGYFKAQNAALANLPVVGELAGFAARERVYSGTEGDLNSLTNQVARFGGPDAISSDTRKFLASTLATQNRNVEQDRQRNEGVATDAVYLRDATEAMNNLANALRGGGAFGASQHGA